MERHLGYSQNTRWNITHKAKKRKKTKPPSKISTISKNKCRRDVSIMRCQSWEAPFISLLQSTTSKTPVTWQRFLQLIHQDAGEIHPCVHLEVGGLERRRGRMGEQWAWCPGCQPRGHREQWRSGEAVHTTWALAAVAGCGTWATARPAVLPSHSWWWCSQPNDTGSGRGAWDLSSTPHTLRQQCLQPRQPETTWRLPAPWCPCWWCQWHQQLQGTSNPRSTTRDGRGTGRGTGSASGRGADE